MYDVVMPNVDQYAKDWQLDWSARIGKAVQDRRKELGVTASDLALRTKQLSYPMTRSTIARIENNHRLGKMDVAELAVLAAALGIPPVMLLFPDIPTAPSRYLPNAHADALHAQRWFTGEVHDADERQRCVQQRLAIRDHVLSMMHIIDG